jgi:hypothetical protein
LGTGIDFPRPTLFQEPDNLPERPCRIALHVFIAEHHEILAVPAHRHPAEHVIPPGAESAIEFPGVTGSF